MNYIGNIIRPPSEAESIILQVTTGCSHNKCTFCGVYKEKTFSIKSEEVINADLDFAALHYKNTRRLFLCDGDALIIPQKRLVGILEKIHEKIPAVGRIATYGSAKSIARKTDKELRELRQSGIKVIHMGLESGDDITLKKVCKYGDSAFITQQGIRAKNAGMKLFITVLLGLGGKERSEIHARETGKALSALDPRYVGALSIMMVDNTPIYTDWKEGKFLLPKPEDMLRELKIMIENTDVSLCLFFANHASNYLSINVRLPKEKENVLDRIDMALSGKIKLKPEWLRGL